MDDLKIKVFSSSSNEDLNPAIIATLKLQSSLIATPETAQQQDGFLISSFDFEELSRLIANHGKLYAATLSGELVGYLLVTPISEFLSLITDDGSHASCGKFLSTQSICFEDFDYLYQIGVSPVMKGCGIGQKLMAYLMENTSRGFLTDVLIDPVQNAVSLKFFKKNGFNEVGILKLNDYRTFGKLKSQVFLWKKETGIKQ